MCNTGPWQLGDRGHGTAGMCGIERCGARAVGGNLGRPKPAAQTPRAGADCPRLGRSAPGTAGGAKHRRQSDDGVAMATALCRERDRRAAARQDPQARQGPHRGGSRGSSGGHVPRFREGRLCTEPPHEATHWTGRGISLGSVQRIWQAHKLQPHRLRTFKRSRDPSFAAKLTDIVGLYVDPPAHAVVLSIDKKSQIQALDRTQPGLPIKPGRCQTMTHDYKRHGTTTLFAALSVLDGTVIGRCMQRHRHLEFIRFLNAVERHVPAGKLIHTVLDNYATHKPPKVLAWLARHPRWTFHFPPTSASWLNAVENFFSKMTRQRIRRGVFHSIADLQAAIKAYLAEHNAHPKPFVWTQSAEAILAKLDRCPAPSV